MPTHDSPREEIHIADKAAEDEVPPAAVAGPDAKHEKEEGADAPPVDVPAAAGAEGEEGTGEEEEEEEGAAPDPPADPVAAAVLEQFPGSVLRDSFGQSVVYVDRAAWHDVALFLRDEQRFTMCLDVCAVDHLLDNERLTVPGVEPERFEVVANYLSHPTNRRIRVICEVPADDPKVPTIVDVHPGMAFGERETYDMYGIEFEGHEDLARILMPDDWVGFPLRKDDAPGRIPVTFKGDPSPR